jgi:LysR family transcriptional regulator, transcriptional activator of nhaA
VPINGATNPATITATMAQLNFKHLRYYWMVAKTGSISRAASQLHLTAHAVSGQLKEFEEALGVALFRRVGRNLELTEAGQRILRHADDIFRLGDEVLATLSDQDVRQSRRFRVGIADAVSKVLAYRLLQPALALEEPIRLIGREGGLALLLAELAVHRLDLILSDQPMPSHLNVRGYSHLLGECALSVFATEELAQSLSGPFPALLDKAPVLLPGADSVLQAQLLKWLDAQRLHPRIVGEFDDSALMKAFGRAGAGVFVAPASTRTQICQQYQVQEIGQIDDITEQVWAITTEARMTDPAIVAISLNAHNNVFLDLHE